MSVKGVEVVVRIYKNALPLPPQSCNLWMVKKENPDWKKEVKATHKDFQKNLNMSIWTLPAIFIKGLILFMVLSYRKGRDHGIEADRSRFHYLHRPKFGFACEFPAIMHNQLSIGVWIVIMKIIKKLPTKICDTVFLFKDVQF